MGRRNDRCPRLISGFEEVSVVATGSEGIVRIIGESEGRSQRCENNSPTIL